MNIFQNLYNQDMEIQRVVSTNLIKLRGEMSRQELAGLAGVSYQHVYEIEEQLKNPSLKVLDRIAKALNISVSILLTENSIEAKPVVRIQGKTTDLLRELIIRREKIPDDVVDMAQGFELDNEVWEEVREAFEEAIKRRNANPKDHSLPGSNGA